MNRLRATILLALLCGASAALAGCAAGLAAAQHPAGTLVVIEPADANTLNPLYANNEPSFLYYGLIFDGLTAPGPNFSTIPWLATSWSSDPSHRHWQVNLRRGVTWSDGAPFTSRDVIFTWQTMLDPKVGFPYAGMFDYVKRVVAEGPYRIRFELSSPNVLFVAQALGSPILPEHILGKIPPGQQRLSSFGEHPIGTGPYELVSWKHDESVLFARNPHWWHGPAKIPRIEFRIVLDDQTRVDAISSGAADLADSLVAQDYRSLLQLAPSLHYVHIPDLFSRFIFVNMTLPGLSDLAVRQAMEYGWDRRAIVQGLLHGDAVLNATITPVALHDWHAPIAPFPYDPARARKLLAAAGYKAGPGGVLRRARTKLAFTLDLPTGDLTLGQIAAEFQADMRALGIAISIQSLDYPTFIDRTNAMHYTLALSGWGGTTDPDEYTFLHSSQIVPVGNNETGFKNATVDRDLVMGLRTFNPARRRRYYDQMQRIVARELPCLWLYDQYFQVAYGDRLALDTHQMQPDLLFWWNVYDWRLRS
ncbi:MAG: ABC transporter substrate-binding protein [Vulcanimicrobiaceae bacterium]